MKTTLHTIILISTFTAFFTHEALACRNKAPLSAVELYVSSTEPVPGVSCKDRPEDQCLCFDHIEGWDVAEVVDDIREDEEGNPVNHGKKLVNNPDKVTAKAIREAEKAEAKRLKDEAKAAVKERLKDKTRLQSANSIAKLRDIIDDLMVVLEEE